MPIAQNIVEAFDSLLDGGWRRFGKIEFRSDQTEQKPAQGSKDFYNPESKITDQTIVGIGSISKQFTAATLLKLWDDELSNRHPELVSESPTQNYFAEGIDTKLANFMPSLRDQYPQCSELFNKIESDVDFSKITLRDLLNHTHGLGARNHEKAMDLVRQADDRPLELTTIANITEKREGEKYGEHKYGNFGYDLVAMIIETVTRKPFDQVVKERVLEPQGLTNTHPQIDHAVLYSNPSCDIAIGYVADEVGEFKMNGTSNTRAAGGFKSTLSDLAKFAPLFMDAKMFENEEVKQVVLAREHGAQMESGKPKTYHLAIQQYSDGTVGHAGNDLIFLSRLRFNPTTKAVEVRLQVAEDLTDSVTKKIFNLAYPEDAADLKAINEKSDFWDGVFWDKFKAVGSPNPIAECEKLHEVIGQALESNSRALELVSRYAAIRERESDGDSAA